MTGKRGQTLKLALAQVSMKSYTEKLPEVRPQDGLLQEHRRAECDSRQLCGQISNAFC